MDHTVRVTEAAFDVVGKPDPSSEDGMEVIVRCGDDDRARHSGQQALEPAECTRGIP